MHSKKHGPKKRGGSSVRKKHRYSLNNSNNTKKAGVGRHAKGNLSSKHTTSKTREPATKAVAKQIYKEKGCHAHKSARLSKINQPTNQPINQSINQQYMCKYTRV
jgi:hypothetical protein